jgi:hypothetical protein
MGRCCCRCTSRTGCGWASWPGGGLIRTAPWPQSPKLTYAASVRADTNLTPALTGLLNAGGTPLTPLQVARRWLPVTAVGHQSAAEPEPVGPQPARVGGDAGKSSRMVSGTTTGTAGTSARVTRRRPGGAEVAIPVRISVAIRRTGRCRVCIHRPPRAFRTPRWLARRRLECAAGSPGHLACQYRCPDSRWAARPMLGSTS